MNRIEIEAKLVEIAGKVLKTSIDATSDAGNTPNWDSLRHVEIVFAAEEALDVEFPEDALTKLKGIQALADAAVAYLEAA